jgi:hypothetical protein
MKRRTSLLLLASLSATPAWAHDWTVDASGSASNLVTINQAMALAAPGDRILVRPGTYPAFQFSRGVEVLGLGTSPGQVVVARVDFHITIPTTGYDAGLSNLTIRSANPSDSTSLAGNELAAGTFVVDGVSIEGAVYLHGAGQLYVLMNNSHVAASPGDGFMGAALDFGGGTLDLVNSWIQASAACEPIGALAGSGLRIQGGSKVRVSGSDVSGGAGVASLASSVYLNGGDAILKSFGTALVDLRLAGHSVIHGGSAAKVGAGGAGGAGVRLAGNIAVGIATVTGGDGAMVGDAYAISAPTMLAYDPLLTLDPEQTFASGDSFVRPGALLRIQADRTLPKPILGFGINLDPPATSSLSPLSVGSTQFRPGGLFRTRVAPASDTVGDPAPLRRSYYQVFFVDPTTGQTVTTNPVAVTIDQ